MLLKQLELRLLGVLLAEAAQVTQTPQLVLDRGVARSLLVSLQIERRFPSKPNGVFHGSRTRFFMMPNGPGAPGAG
jgi:hypothetical protein